jgi:hypothetical protein
MTVLWSMRALAATGIAVTLAALAGGAEARDVSIYRGKCGEVVLPSGPTGLGSALRIRTACGAFVVDRHGVRYAGPYGKGPKWEGLMARRGRLLLYRGDRVVWRSRQRRYGVPAWVVESGRSLAFAFMARARLYVAELEGPERAVGRLGEYPLGWTRAGLLVTAQENVLRARTRSGRLVRILKQEAGRREFDSGSRTLVYVSRQGALVRTDGRRVQTLVAGGLRRSADIRPLEEGRLALVDRRLVVLRPDGSLLASDRRRFNLPALTSNGAIAMIATGPLDGYSRSTESVRLLRPGQRSSTLLHTAKVGALGCGHWPTLAWRGSELLYSTNEGQVVVMKPSSGGHLDLTGVVRRLPGEFLEARWS